MLVRDAVFLRQIEDMFFVCPAIGCLEPASPEVVGPVVADVNSPLGQGGRFFRKMLDEYTVFR